jgi:NAD(P)-dependent dehydrogenase (short-subunit alcohol dehydrogenase family)
LGQRYVSTAGGMHLDLTDRVYVVSGGSSGIGLATVSRLIAWGARVATCARDESKLVHALQRFPTSRVLGEVADVYDADACANLVEGAARHFGRLDGVAAVAGHGLHGGIRDLRSDDWVTELGQKVLSVIHLVRPALPLLAESKGSIVTIETPSARSPDPRMMAIGASRAAVSNLTRSLAAELAPGGVRVNSVSVGFVDTARQRERYERVSGTEQTYADWLESEIARRQVPMGRAGLADEVAVAIGLLLSPYLSYTTGSTIAVSGGL